MAGYTHVDFTPTFIRPLITMATLLAFKAQTLRVCRSPDQLKS